MNPKVKADLLQSLETITEAVRDMTERYDDIEGTTILLALNGVRKTVEAQ